ncbi:hypothetical protein GDO81_012056 [Engystomops pustulosus]|uniref:Uncharacterized protein n=1 Tax=Engystomops pustulosus TaxID=76066 RepID=A0AAV7BIZ2_ENGPU|nr:hypothetical protein GDO81_012056 [Engystomops pustulosus]
MQLKLQQASLEAERARQQASLEAEQASLDLERARLEATLEKLTIEREAAAAMAEAEILEAAAFSHSEPSRHSSMPDLEQEPQDTLERTSEYVLQHPACTPQTTHETKVTNCESSPRHHILRQEADLRPHFCKQENATAQAFKLLPPGWKIHGSK